MIRISAQEGLPLDVDPETAFAIRERLAALEVELAPRISFLSGSGGAPKIRNLVGSVQVTADLVVDISPKTEPGADWAGSLIDLMTDERAHLGGETHEAELSTRRSLPDAFARIYSHQLIRAIRREGPLQLLRHRPVSKAVLSGRLNVTRWVHQRTVRPNKFPQMETVLTADNEFTGAMAWVAEALATRVSDHTTRSRLRAAARALRPGLPPHTYVDPGVAFRPIPPQWRAYGPAWVTAGAVLRRLSPLHRSGTQEGLSLAVEPWPLLETLLHRSLREAVRMSAAGGVPLTMSPQSAHPFLTPIARAQSTAFSDVHTPRQVEPDGSLWLNGQPVATFEAKYSVPTYASTRGHFFQAATTAAAVGAPLSVLIYPGRSEPIRWRNVGVSQSPVDVVAVGLDMYSYRRGLGDRDRGRLLLDVAADAVADRLAGQLP